MGERPTSSRATDLDVLIVGAGLSGIGMAAHMKEKTPGHSFAIVERRDDLGGTWDLFRYPGVRSDSDMHTLGFEFEPWKHEKTIADGPAILDYLHRIVDERDIRRHIRFQHKVISADFRKADARWHVTLEMPDGERKMLTANWLYLGSGYYDYDEAYDPGFELGEFEGQVLHPQFWPKDLDYSDKQVVVIGSGATAVTLVPSMAKKAAKVTMLQRTPTWMFSRPAKDRVANFLRKVLPEKVAYAITRWKNITMQDFTFKLARRKPKKMRAILHKRIRQSMGEDYDLAAFTPPYNPWDQRLCLIPDDDLFDAIKRGKAEIVTGHIAAFEKGGVRLTDDRFLAVDIVVMATGLKLAVAGKIALTLEGQPIDLADRYYYKGCMFSNLPNLAVVFGYLNASWTLRADINADFICRVLNAMAEESADIATPYLPEGHTLEEDNIFDFSSGYIQRSRHLMPKNAVEYPWRLNQEYVVDRKRMKKDPVDDGILVLSRKGDAAAKNDARLQAAR
ncbi:MAG: FAD-containing monooxygenase EthA [Erythrobacter sp.]|mgnify:FL=1|nr:FAD-containing monooxygenase EthA [Erythrobacter sp.]